MKHLCNGCIRWLAIGLLSTAGSLSAQDLTNAGAIITIQSGATITVQGGVLNQGAGAFQSDGVMEIGGDVTNNGTATAALGRVLLNGSASQAIAGSQELTFSDLVVNNATGVVLNQNILVDNTLEMQAGSVDLNGQNIELSEVANIMGETDANRIFGSTGTIRTTRSFAALSSENIGNMGVEITTASTMGATIIVRGHEPQNVGTGVSIARYFDVMPDNNTNLDATLKMYYFPSELNGQTAGSLALFRLNSGATNWTPAGGVSDVGGAFVEQSGIDAMALWTLSADGTTGLDWKPSVAMVTFPNPLSAGESLQITGLEAGTYTVSLFDVRGRQVVQRDIQSASAGTEVSLGLPVLTEGVYTIRLENPDFRPAMGKLIIH